MVFYRTIIYLLIISIVVCCNKSEDFSNIPQLTFQNLNPTSIIEFDGPITFSIIYKDGDGDLGENNPNINNLFLKDQRNNIIYEYRIQELSPNGANIAITGSIDLVLNTTSITDESNEQEAIFDIYVIDRAGNQSNTISSDPLTIYKKL